MKVNRDVLIAKLGYLQDSISRIEEKQPPSLEVLLADRDLQDILAKNIERSVQVCVDIASHVVAANGWVEDTAGETFRILADNEMLDRDLAKSMIHAVGFRNVSVHEYVKVSWVVVMKIVTEDLDQLKAFGRWASELVSNAAPPPPGGRL